METRPCGQLAPPGSAPRPGPGVAETPRRGASHAWSRKKALVLVSTRRPSACSRGPPGGSAADQPDQEPRADAGSTPGDAPITPLRGAAPGSRGGRRPWALPGTSVELHSALPVGTSFQVRRAKAWCWHRSRHLMNPPPPPPLRCLVPVNATPNTVHTAVTRSHAYPLVLSRKVFGVFRMLSGSSPASPTPPSPGCRPPTARTLVSTITLNKEPTLRPAAGKGAPRSGRCRREDRPGHSSAAARRWPGMSGRVPLAERALSEGHARRRYRDASLLIWQQQQRELESVPPGTYLSRSRSMWYSQYGNEAILVRDRNKLEVSRDTGQSRFCSVM